MQNNPILRYFKTKKNLKKRQSTPVILKATNNGYNNVNYQNELNEQNTIIAYRHKYSKDYLSNIKQSKSEICNYESFMSDKNSRNSSCSKCTCTSQDSFEIKSIHKKQKILQSELIPKPVKQKEPLNITTVGYSFNGGKRRNISIPMFRLEKAAYKLSKVINKKRNYSNEERNIELATKKLQNWMDQKVQGKLIIRNIKKCFPITKIKNEASKEFKQKDDSSKIKKFEDLIYKKKNLDIDTPSTFTFSGEHLTTSLIDKNISIDNSTKKEKKIYSIEYINSLKNLSECNKTDKLTNQLLFHIINLQKNIIIVKDEDINSKRKSHNSDPSCITKIYSIYNDVNNSLKEKKDLENWGRKDISKEIKEAEKNVENIQHFLNSDNLKHDITSILNLLTVDNFDTIKTDLYKIIKDSKEAQTKFVEVILKKAITEKFYVSLYAKLSHHLNKLIYPDIKDKKSFLEVQLIESTKALFHHKNISSFKDKENDDDDQMKKYTIGNVRLINEFIKEKVLSQKIGFYCIDSLFERYYDNRTPIKKKLIILEALVVLIDGFGQLVYQKGKEANIIKINDYINKSLNDIKEHGELPSHLKYKIINLVSKRDNNWEDTLFQKATVAQGKNDRCLTETVDETPEKKKDINVNANVNFDTPLKKKVELETQITSIKKQTKIEKSLDEDAIINEIKNDLKLWYKHYTFNSTLPSSEPDEQKEKVINAFNWKTMENLIDVKKVHLSEIIRLFIEIAIDEGNNPSIIAKMNQYIMSVIEFYSIEFSYRETQKLRIRMCDLFTRVNDLIIDNKNILTVLGNILYILIHNKIILMKDLNMFVDKDRETITNIIKIAKIATDIKPKLQKKFTNDFKQGKLFIENKELFEEIFRN